MNRDEAARTPSKRLRAGAAAMADHPAADPIVYALLAAAFLSLWHGWVTRTFSPEAFFVFVVLCGASLAYGRLFFRVAACCISVAPGLSAQFLSGYFILNTSGFLLFFLTRLSIGTIILTLSGFGLLSLLLPVLKNPRNFPPNEESSRGAANPTPDRLSTTNRLPDFFCLLLSGLGSTLWCNDSLTPIVGNSNVAVYRMWLDSFFHARAISAFAQAHGFASMSNIGMAGTPATIYHYACYVMPAAVASLTDTYSYRILGGFLIPFGILFTGLAAFTLMSAVWGRWPGLAAALAVVLLPDAYQQGFQNKFLSYNFLQQVNPGGLYGVSLIALAWMFMLDACKTGKWPAILFAYGIALISVVYKAQLFVANAFLIMIYPCLFFRPVKPVWRVAAGFALTSLFLFVAGLSQRSDTIPTLRLDASGAKAYAYLILLNFDSGGLQDFYHLKLTHEVSPAFHLIMAGMVLLTTFGLWLAVCIILFFLPKARPDRAIRFFPILVMINYAIMSVCLALDTRRLGMPEELLHRPLVWAYFAVVAWSGAALYACLVGEGPPKSIPLRLAASLFALLCLVVPCKFGDNIQTMPAWPRCARFIDFNIAPVAFQQACDFIRLHSPQSDIIQSSDYDKNFAFTALAERNEFAIETNLRQPPGLHERLAALDSFKKMTNATAITDFARQSRISWYLLNPKSHVEWPNAFLETAVFKSQGCRLFHFQQ